MSRNLTTKDIESAVLYVCEEVLISKYGVLFEQCPLGGAATESTMEDFCAAVLLKSRDQPVIKGNIIHHHSFIEQSAFIFARRFIENWSRYSKNTLRSRYQCAPSCTIERVPMREKDVSAHKKALYTFLTQNHASDARTEALYTKFVVAHIMFLRQDKALRLYYCSTADQLPNLFRSLYTQSLNMELSNGLNALQIAKIYNNTRMVDHIMQLSKQNNILLETCEPTLMGYLLEKSDRLSDALAQQEHLRHEKVSTNTLDRLSVEMPICQDRRRLSSIVHTSEFISPLRYATIAAVASDDVPLLQYLCSEDCAPHFEEPAWDKDAAFLALASNNPTIARLCLAKVEAPAALSALAKWVAFFPNKKDTELTWLQERFSLVMELTRFKQSHPYTDSTGNTMLHLAVQISLDLALQVFEAGRGEWDATNQDGESPLDIKNSQCVVAREQLFLEAEIGGVVSVLGRKILEIASDANDGDRERRRILRSWLYRAPGEVDPSLLDAAARNATSADLFKSLYGALSGEEQIEALEENSGRLLLLAVGENTIESMPPIERNARKEIVDFLVKQGVCTDKVLPIALQQRKAELALSMLDTYQTSVNVQITLENDSKTTLLHLAAQAAEPSELIKALLKKGADVSTRDESSRPAPFIQYQHADNTLSGLYEEFMALISGGNWDKLKAFLDLRNYTWLNIEDPITGKFPLHVMAEKGHAHLMQKLQEDSAAWQIIDPKRSHSDLSPFKRHPLHYAVLSKSVETFNIIVAALKQGDDTNAVNVQDSDGHTALHLAVVVNNAKMLSAVQSAGVNPSILNKDSMLAKDMDVPGFFKRNRLKEEAEKASNLERRCRLTLSSINIKSALVSYASREIYSQTLQSIMDKVNTQTSEATRDIDFLRQLSSQCTTLKKAVDRESRDARAQHDGIIIHLSSMITENRDFPESYKWLITESRYLAINYLQNVAPTSWQSYYQLKCYLSKMIFLINPHQSKIASILSEQQKIAFQVGCFVLLLYDCPVIPEEKITVLLDTLESWKIPINLTEFGKHFLSETFIGSQLYLFTEEVHMRYNACQGNKALHVHLTQAQAAQCASNLALLQDALIKKDPGEGIDTLYDYMKTALPSRQQPGFPARAAPQWSGQKVPDSSLWQSALAIRVDLIRDCQHLAKILSSKIHAPIIAPDAASACIEDAKALMRDLPNCTYFLTPLDLGLVDNKQIAMKQYMLDQRELGLVKNAMTEACSRIVGTVEKAISSMRENASRDLNICKRFFVEKQRYGKLAWIFEDGRFPSGPYDNLESELDAIAANGNHEMIYARPGFHQITYHIWMTKGKMVGEYRLEPSGVVAKIIVEHGEGSYDRFSATVSDLENTRKRGGSTLASAHQAFLQRASARHVVLKLNINAMKNDYDLLTSDRRKRKMSWFGAKTLEGQWEPIQENIHSLAEQINVLKRMLTTPDRLSKAESSHPDLPLLLLEELAVCEKISAHLIQLSAETTKPVKKAVEAAKAEQDKAEKTVKDQERGKATKLALQLRGYLERINTHNRQIVAYGGTDKAVKIDVTLQNAKRAYMACVDEALTLFPRQLMIPSSREEEIFCTQNFDGEVYKDIQHWSYRRTKIKTALDECDKAWKTSKSIQATATKRIKLAEKERDKEAERAKKANERAKKLQVASANNERYAQLKQDIAPLNSSMGTFNRFIRDENCRVDTTMLYSSVEALNSLLRQGKVKCDETLFSQAVKTLDLVTTTIQTTTDSLRRAINSRKDLQRSVEAVKSHLHDHRDIRRILNKNPQLTLQLDDGTDRITEFISPYNTLVTSAALPDSSETYRKKENEVILRANNIRMGLAMELHAVLLGDIRKQLLIIRELSPNYSMPIPIGENINKDHRSLEESAMRCMECIKMMYEHKEQLETVKIAEYHQSLHELSLNIIDHNNSIKEINAALTKDGFTIIAKDVAHFDALRLTVQEPSIFRRATASTTRALQHILFSQNICEGHYMSSKELQPLIKSLGAIISQWKSQMERYASNKREEEEKNQAEFEKDVRPNLGRLNEQWLSLSKKHMESAAGIAEQLEKIPSLLLSSEITGANPQVFINPDASRNVGPELRQQIVSHIQALAEKAEQIITGATQYDLALTELALATAECDSAIITLNNVLSKDMHSALSDPLNILRDILCGPDGFWHLQKKNTKSQLIVFDFNQQTYKAMMGANQEGKVITHQLQTTDMSARINAEIHNINTCITGRRALDIKYREYKKVMATHKQSGLLARTEEQDRLCGISDTFTAYHQGRIHAAHAVEPNHFPDAINSFSELLGEIDKIMEHRREQKDQESRAQERLQQQDTLSQIIEVDINPALAQLSKKGGAAAVTSYCSGFNQYVASTNQGTESISAEGLDERTADEVANIIGMCETLFDDINKDIAKADEAIKRDYDAQLLALENQCQACDAAIIMINESLQDRQDRVSDIAMSLEALRKELNFVFHFNRTRFEVSTDRCLPKIEFHRSKIDGTQHRSRQRLAHLIAQANELKLNIEKKYTVIEAVKKQEALEQAAKAKTEAQAATAKHEEEEANQVAFERDVAPKLASLNEHLTCLGQKNMKLSESVSQQFRLTTSLRICNARNAPHQLQINVDATKTVNPVNREAIIRQVDAAIGSAAGIINGADEYDAALAALEVDIAACNIAITQVNEHLFRGKVHSALCATLDELRNSLCDMGIFSAASKEHCLASFNFNAGKYRSKDSNSNAEKAQGFTISVKAITQQINDEQENIARSVIDQSTLHQTYHNYTKKTILWRDEGLMTDHHAEQQENLDAIMGKFTAYNEILTQVLLAEHKEMFSGAVAESKDLWDQLTVIMAHRRELKDQESREQTLSTLKEQITGHIQDVNLSLDRLQSMIPPAKRSAILLCDPLRRLVKCQNKAAEAISTDNLDSLSAEQIIQSIAEATRLLAAIQTEIDQVESQNRSEHHSQLQTLVAHVKSCNQTIAEINDTLKAGSNVNTALIRQLDELRHKVQQNPRFGVSKKNASCLHTIEVNAAHCQKHYPEKAAIKVLVDDASSLAVQISINLTAIKEEQRAKSESEAAERDATVNEIAAKIDIFNGKLSPMARDIGDLKDPFVVNMVLPLLQKIRKHFGCHETRFTPLTVPDIHSSFYNEITLDDANERLAQIDTIQQSILAELQIRSCAVLIAADQYKGCRNAFKPRWAEAPNQAAMEKSSVAEINRLYQNAMQVANDRRTLAGFSRFTQELEQYHQHLGEIKDCSETISLNIGQIESISKTITEASDEFDALIQERNTAQSTFESSVQHLAHLKHYSAALTTILTQHEALRDIERTKIAAKIALCTKLTDGIKSSLGQLLPSTPNLQPQENALLCVDIPALNYHSLKAHEAQLVVLSSQVDQALTAQTEAEEEASKLAVTKAKIADGLARVRTLLQWLQAVNPGAIGNIQQQFELINKTYPPETDNLSYCSGILGQIEDIDEDLRAKQSQINQSLSLLQDKIKSTTAKIEEQLKALDEDVDDLAQRYKNEIHDTTDEATLEGHQRRLEQQTEFLGEVSQAAAAKQHKEAEAKQKAEGELRSAVGQLNVIACQLNDGINVKVAWQLKEELVTQYDGLRKQLEKAHVKRLFNLFSAPKVSTTRQLQIIAVDDATLEKKTTQVITALQSTLEDMTKTLHSESQALLRETLKQPIVERQQNIEKQPLSENQAARLKACTDTLQGLVDAAPKEYERLLQKITQLDNDVAAKHLRDKIKDLATSLVGSAEINPDEKEKIMRIVGDFNALKKQTSPLSKYHELLEQLEQLKEKNQRPPIAAERKSPSEPDASLGGHQPACSAPRQNGKELSPIASQRRVDPKMVGESGKFFSMIDALLKGLTVCYDKKLNRTVTRPEMECFEKFWSILAEILAHLVGEDSLPSMTQNIIKDNGRIMSFFSQLNNRCEQGKGETNSGDAAAEYCYAQSPPQVALSQKMIDEIKKLEIAYCVEYYSLAQEIHDHNGAKEASKKIPDRGQDKGACVIC